MSLIVPVSVVVPVYNAEQTLRTLVAALAALGESFPLELDPGERRQPGSQLGHHR